MESCAWLLLALFGGFGALELFQFGIDCKQRRWNLDERGSSISSHDCQEHALYLITTLSHAPPTPLAFLHLSIPLATFVRGSGGDG